MTEITHYFFQRLMKQLLTICTTWVLRRNTFILAKVIITGRGSWWSLICGVYSGLIYFIQQLYSCITQVGNNRRKMRFCNKDLFNKCDQSTENCGFGHIYWRNSWWKTSFLCSEQQENPIAFWIFFVHFLVPLVFQILCWLALTVK